MLKRKELKFLSCLRADGRVTLTNASKLTRLPVSTLFEKLKKYKSTYIKRSTVLLNFETLGYTARAIILFKTSREFRPKLESLLMKNIHMNNLQRLSNSWDYLFEGIFVDLQELHDFIDTLESKIPVTKEVLFILSDLQKEAFLANTGLLSLESPPVSLKKVPDTIKDR